MSLSTSAEPCWMYSEKRFGSLFTFVSVVNMLWSVKWFTSVGTCPGSQGSGFKVLGAGCRVQGAGCWVQGSGFRVQGSGFRVQGAEFSISMNVNTDMNMLCSVKWFTSVGTCVWVRGLGFGVRGLVFEVWGVEFGVWGLGLVVWIWCLQSRA